MLRVRFAASISHNRLFGTRSFELRRTAASSRVNPLTSDRESPKLLRSARRCLPDVRAFVGIVVEATTADRVGRAARHALA